MPGNPLYNTPAWKAIRAQVLEEEPICHWCHTKPSTQVDHIQELDAEGPALDRANLCGSCAPCNASRGARYVNRKTAQRIQKRNETPKPFLFSPTNTPNPHLPCISEGNQAEPAGTGGALPASSIYWGRVEPRLVTAVRGATGTYGPLVAQWAERHLGKTLMPWQRLALDGQLSHDADGNLLFRESLVTCGRQQGKTVGGQALLGWWVTDFAAMRGKPQQALSTAHKLDRASALFREVAPILETHFGAKVGWSYGRMRAELADGSAWSVSAATEANAHGSTNDLIFIDELWSVPQAVVFDAYRPSQIARPSPLMSMWSTAGDESSTAMLRLKSQAMAAIDMGKPSRLYFAEWSPPPGVNVDDRQWWAWANPALGTTVSMAALEAAFDSPDRNAFLRAHLNLFIAAQSSWLPSGTWEQCRSNQPIPDGGWLACDSSLDDSRYVGVRAVNVDGNIMVSLAFVADSENAMWQEIERHTADPNVKLAVTPTLELHCPPALKRRTTVVGYAELVKYTSLVRAMIAEGKVTHDGSATLAEHIGRAVAAKTQNTTVLSSQKSVGPIEAARCAVWAVSLASRPNTKSRAAFASA